MDDQRYIDQPYVVEITMIERLQAALDVLSDSCLTPLPRRLLAKFESLRGRLEVIRKELERRPQAVSAERAREERRRSG